MNSSLYKGSLESIVLKLLESQKELYGYAICQQIKQLSKDQYLVNEGALYPLLKTLESKELIESSSRTYQNRIRKYYRLTTKGKKYALGKENEMVAYLHFINNLLTLKPT